jgi:Cache domain
MVQNLPVVVTACLMCILILLSVPSYLGLASFGQSAPHTISASEATNHSENSTAATEQSKDQNIELKLVSRDIEDNLRDGVAALQLVDNNGSPMTVQPNGTLLKSTFKMLHGIPPNGDESKRKLALDVLSKYKIFEYIGYLTPRGDVYFAEPYSPAQTSLHNPNFAYREHFKRAIATDAPYMSNVINSLSFYGKPHAAIAIPIHSQNSSKSLIGVLVAGLNFTYFDHALRSLNMTDSAHRLIIADHNGTAIFDSSINKTSATKPESISSLQSFRNAMEGKYGSLIEPINGTKMFISYQPLKAVQRTWAILLMKTM